MRDFGSLLTELEDGEVEKLVLTQRNRMRAVVVSVERWSELEEALRSKLVECPVHRTVGMTRPLSLPTGPRSLLRPALSRRSVASSAWACAITIQVNYRLSAPC